jgi:hypothetical protein
LHFHPTGSQAHVPTSTFRNDFLWLHWSTCPRFTGNRASATSLGFRDSISGCASTNDTIHPFFRAHLKDLKFSNSGSIITYPFGIPRAPVLTCPFQDFQMSSRNCKHTLESHGHALSRAHFKISEIPAINCS